MFQPHEKLFVYKTSYIQFLNVFCFCHHIHYRMAHDEYIIGKIHNECKQNPLIFLSMFTHRHIFHCTSGTIPSDAFKIWLNDIKESIYIFQIIVLDQVIHEAHIYISTYLCIKTFVQCVTQATKAIKMNCLLYVKTKWFTTHIVYISQRMRGSTDICIVQTF